ncbi:hypothetical protein LE191_04200 [Janthinobacterium sp. HSC-3S05]|uniref:phage adaptor protein n=1 Tax=Janthinobacterium lividum TaxID=29581 RepID=UPI001CD8F87A|nr:hypothetical protein [Janthinobacterium lividum]MCA1859311.1 hypothetical protein [Janthinobacterium lividum]MCL6482858.1 hypothetical protein [Janthinobacterium lividum]
MVKTLLNVIQQVSRELAQPVPSAVLSDQTASTQQLLALTIASCDELSDMHDWQRLRKTATVTSVNGTAEYALPADFLRMVPNTQWDRTNTRALAGGLSPSSWAGLNQTSLGVQTNFRMMGNKLMLFPTPGSTPVSITYEYISRFYVQPTGSTLMQAEFNQDSDGTVFHDRLLINFVKLKFMQEQGMNTYATTENFNTSLASAKSTDTPAPVISLNGGPSSHFLDASNIPVRDWNH